MSKVVAEVGTKEVEEVQQAVKYYYLLSFILKPPSLITQGVKENKKAHEKLFKCMCNFGAR